MVASRILLAFLLLGTLAFAQQKPETLRSQTSAEYRVRLLPIAEGLRDGARNLPEQDPRKTEIYLTAAQYGVDLTKYRDKLVSHKCADGKLFSLYYTRLDNAFGDRPYVIQRLKMTKRSFDQKGKELPQETTYLVEAFKTKAGTIKGIDQHHGGYSLGNLGRREIVKELEIGYGEIPDICEGERWPFPAGHLYKKLLDYDEDPSMYEAVRFTNSVKYSLRVAFDDQDNYTIESPELEFKLPEQSPRKDRARVKKDPISRKLVLIAGKGGAGITFGSTGKDVQKRLGRHIEAVYESPTERLFSYHKDVTLKVKDKQITAIYTQSSFTGKTKRGIRLGDKKSKVAKAYGKPSKIERYKWSYRGIVFRFDAFDRVRTISIYKR